MVERFKLKVTGEQMAKIDRLAPNTDYEVTSQVVLPDDRTAVIEALAHSFEKARWLATVGRLRGGHGDIDGEALMADLEARGFTIKRME